MQAVNLLLPLDSFHESEQLELKEIFSNPLVARYLRHLAVEDNKELIEISVLDMPADFVVRRHTMVQGRMSAYATLLSLALPKEPQK